MLNFFKRKSEDNVTPKAIKCSTDVDDTPTSMIEHATTAPVLDGTPNSRPSFLKRRGNYTNHEYKQQFIPMDSFVDKLPYVEFLDAENVLLLEDGKSVAAVFELTVIGTEGRSLDYLEEIRTQITHALQDSFAELDTHPWVVQFFCQDDEMAMEYEDILRQYVRPNAQGSEFTENWLKVMGKHLRDVSKSGGLFEDKAVTGTQWRGQQRRTRMVIYRYVNPNMTFDRALEDLNATCESVTNALLGAGVKSKRCNGYEVHQWLLRWFNPNPVDYERAEDFYKVAHYTESTGVKKDDPFLYNDFTETLLVQSPRTEGEFWYFDELPHTVVVVDSLRRSPEVGHLTGEVKRGDNVNALFDLLPEHTIMAMTIVVYPQDLLENHLLKISKGALGENTESIYTKSAVTQVKQYLQEKHKLYQSSLCFFLRAKDEKTLISQRRKLVTTLQATGLIATREGAEIAPLSSYIRWLPMVFDPQSDPKHLYTKFNFVQHIANLLPLFGRSIGTRHPGITYFNRGGSPLDFDPLNKDDRAKSGHLLLLGPTGAGKSATLNGKIAQLMAMYRPRLFIIEAGNSFGLMAEYAKRYGLTVNHIQLKPGSGVSLPLFADAQKVIDAYNIDDIIFDNEKRFDDSPVIPLAEDANIEVDTQNDVDNDILADDQRDILGEMEIIARLMITGGKEKEYEKMTRADEAMIRRAIILAANQTRKAGKTCLTEDIAKAFHEISKDATLPPKYRERAYEMGESIGLFCQPGSFDAELFNRDGEPWPDADITLVDLATLARDGYDVQLSIAYISLINHINSMGEKYQFSGRPIVNITDEAHIITVNPMLASFLAKGGKMWRKLGIWLWLATQNMADFPDVAKKLLSMLEWWELLYLEKDEVNQVSRFKQLTPEQTDLLLSTKKENRKYTEGVVLSSKMEALFRVVPPSIYLALAMTENEEKAERAELMRKHGISELDAALMVAKNIDNARGINE
ncbi:conjugative transfer ATPase [Actinobacillus delphinicola]|uniref:Conjugal transfer ATPase TrbE n=1 Tax=Actinobacillus delphinicola TaxID=51161 RepID=A0A448TU66_9PAST|nr:conjugative transfer ATPase [Actinobacillus delphinicola]VEJ09393.1 conjugal transfer ATPase TrbE [Actinobacillus delphinicola]